MGRDEMESLVSEYEFVEEFEGRAMISTDNLWLLPMKPNNRLSRVRGLEHIHGKDFFQANCFEKGRDKSGRVTGYWLTYAGYLALCQRYFNLGLKGVVETIDTQFDFVERSLRDS